MAVTDWEHSTMTMEEWEKEIDTFIEEENKKRKTSEMLWEGRGGNEVKGFSRGITNKTVTQDLIRRFSLACGDFNPLFRDPDYAVTTKWGGIIAPPLIIHCVGYPGVQIPALPDTIGGVSMMDAGIDHEFYIPIRPGDTFTATSTYLGVTELTRKNPKKRQMLSCSRCDYYNQNNEKVCSAVGKVFIICMAPGTPAAGTGLTPEQAWAYKQPSYSEETLNEIYAQYEDEVAGKLARGSEPRYWDDVNEGDTLTPLLIGPLDNSDLVTYAGVTMNTGYPGAFAHKYLNTKLDKSLYHTDSETGSITLADFHYERVAKEMGFPQGVHYGAQSMGIISHALTNWAGDDAFVKVMNFQCRKMLFIGDTNTTTGKIVRKYEKDGEHLVDVDLSSVNQNGAAHTICSATVALPVRG